MEDKNASVLPPVKSGQDSSELGSLQEISGDIEALTGPSTKEVLMGVGLLLILSVVFFFIRNAFVGYLVGPAMKRSPNNAAMAGWGLFGGLFFASAILCVALFGKIFLTMFVVIPLSIAMILCFVLAVVMSAKK
ncbi:hypothetical protein Cpar_0940 [Chlorobaculum parvum NCIB 8327]|uniref:Uncharacterized protein n=1 Tax=Chlorobaculum parvum (strain DSM 263 / NCIMB 8327) TaxID=517417 RepID=B3QN47_CHLP8|nr:hypothetical protein [Chlorobaculum parvum]ACF11350.1 hypothetical protein Cpar_0940 [Chlorobaculum parvum NCIB 8327]